MKFVKNIRRGLWLGTLVVFLILIIDSFQGMTKSYPTFDYRIPPEFNIQIGSVRFQNVVNNFADQFDDNIKQINEDNHENSTIAFWTNIASFLMALMGFCLEAQKEAAGSKPVKKRI